MFDFWFRYKPVYDIVTKERYLTRLVFFRTEDHSDWRLHYFHAPDMDRCVHDHPGAFFTFPLTGYYEIVLGKDNVERSNWVSAWRWHYRPKGYRHRVIGRTKNRWWHKFLPYGFTIVRTINWTDEWGFWIMDEGELKKIHWQQYNDLLANTGRSSNGRTTDFESVNEGSIPSLPTN